MLARCLLGIGAMVPEPPRPVRIVGATLVCVLTAALLFAFARLGPVLMVVGLGLVLSTATQPAVERLCRLGLGRTLAILVVYTLVAASLGAVLFWGAPSVERQVTALLERLPMLCESALSRLLDGPWRPLVERFTASDCTALVGARVMQALRGQAAPLASAVWTMCALLVVGAAWTRERGQVLRLLLTFAADERRQPLRQLWDDVEARLGAYVRGQLMLCLVGGVLAGAAYLFLGLPSPLLLALVSAIGEALPVVGPLIAAGLALLVAATGNPGALLAVVGISVGLRLVMDYLVLPYVMGKSTGVNAFLLLVGVLAFATAGGLLGAALAAPAMAVLQMLVQRAVSAPQTGDLPEGRDRTSLLVYRARAIAAAARRLGQRENAQGGSGVLAHEIELLALELGDRADGREEGSS